MFTQIREAGLQVKFSKCKFLQQQVKYLGHILSKESGATDPDTIRTLTEWEVPTNSNGVVQFLGLANYFHKFIPNPSILATPVYALTKKQAVFDGNEDALLAFQAIKLALASPAGPAYPAPYKPYE